jgi:hypothetical protein
LRAYVFPGVGMLTAPAVAIDHRSQCLHASRSKSVKLNLRRVSADIRLCVASTLEQSVRMERMALMVASVREAKTSRKLVATVRAVSEARYAGKPQAAICIRLVLPVIDRETSASRTRRVRDKALRYLDIAYGQRPQLTSAPIQRKVHRLRLQSRSNTSRRNA